MKICGCEYMLKEKTYNLRKSDKNKKWGYIELTLNKFIHYANRYSISTAVFASRNTKYIKIPQQMVMIDVDEPENNVEEKLSHHGLHYFKVPSGSNTGDKNGFKWHYFVMLSEPLSKDAAIAKGQLKAFYVELGIDGYDATAIDVVRYFAPCGCAEIKDTPEWNKRVKWCDKNSTEVQGNSYVPNDNVMPIYSGKGKQVSIKAKKSNFSAGGDEWEPVLKCKLKEDKSGHSWRLESDTPISVDGGAWSSAGEIAAALNVGETVSNYVGCPGFNHEHSEHPSTVGYGYVYKDDGITFFNCGGSACAGDTYYLFDEPADVDADKKLKFGKEV